MQLRYWRPPLSQGGKGGSVSGSRQELFKEKVTWQSLSATSEVSPEAQALDVWKLRFPDPLATGSHFISANTRCSSVNGSGGLP